MSENQPEKALFQMIAEALTPEAHCRRIFAAERKGAEQVDLC